jgi:hypothetical protein
MTFEEAVSRLDAAGWSLWHLGRSGDKWVASAYRKQAVWTGKVGSGLWPKSDHTPSVASPTLEGVFDALLATVGEERLNPEQAAMLERAISRLAAAFDGFNHA